MLETWCVNVFRRPVLPGKAARCIKWRTLMKLPSLLALLTMMVSAGETIERIDPALDAIIDPQAEVETLCTGARQWL